jgi:hypothetical protein
VAAQTLIVLGSISHLRRLADQKIPDSGLRIPDTDLRTL